MAIISLTCTNSGGNSRDHDDGNDKEGSENHRTKETTGKGADVGPVQHELALIVVLLLR